MKLFSDIAAPLMIKWPQFQEMAFNIHLLLIGLTLYRTETLSDLSEGSSYEVHLTQNT